MSEPTDAEVAAFLEQLSDDELEMLSDLVDIEQQSDESFAVALEESAPTLESFGRRLGRPLTNGELHAVAEVVDEQVASGAGIDPDEAWREAHDRRGRSPFDLDRSGDRVDYMAERLSDIDRERAEVEAAAPPVHTTHDLDTDAGRRAYVSEAAARTGS